MLLIPLCILKTKFSKLHLSVFDYLDRLISASHSEPNIANSIGRHSHRKAVAGQLRTASSRPKAVYM
ncbi:hypothetical protein BHE74_00007461 [Ensete ventricosum]|nr:hypothetical protein BHE74_00007461 [Ensete ventricosum]RZR91196.1 hypothetical protein BHM03_00019247 [Ensete ventricosum]